jgi:hypothetical protein
MKNYAAHPDLTEWSLKNPNLELYTDSSSFVKNGVRHAELAVVTEFDTLQSGCQNSSSTGRISVSNRSPKTVKRTESQHLYKI